MTAPIRREAIVELADSFVHGLDGLSGLRLAYDLAALSDLDAWLAEWLDMAAIYDAPALPDTSLVEPIAAYVGEVLVRSAGASWDFAAANDQMLPPLRFGNGQRIDLSAAVRAVLERSASPAFHQLARLATDSASD